VQSVILQLADAGDGKPQLMHLRPGDSVTFGRGAPGCPVDVELPYDGVSRRAGHICAVGDYWTLSNLSQHTTYLVENLEGAGEHIKVSPRRLGAPVAFELSRLLLPVTDGTYEIKVFAPQHAYADEGQPLDVGEPTVAPFSLNHEAKYFRVLVALCEPRLREGGSVAVPSARQVCGRLASAEGYEQLTTAAVHYHVEYLATAKFRLKGPVAVEGAERMLWRRDAVVATALRFNLVREEHLALLPKAGRARSAAHADG
jgi:hypothetical protein